MQVKFIQHLERYNYLIMFDLASKVSGVCVWDIKASRPLRTAKIELSKDTELDQRELFEAIDSFFKELFLSGIDKESILVYKEAMPVQVRGGHSTMQTFIALSKSHAVLDLYLSLNNIDVYDYVGIYPISTHSYLKKLVTFQKDHKVTKDDIAQYVKDFYGLENLSYDESDSVFLAKTFVEVKWNKDLKEEIKDIKKKIKSH